MKISFKVNDVITIEANAEKQVNAFQTIADLQDIFGEKTCGCCGSHNIKFNARKARSKDQKQVFTFYEMACTEPNCGAKLSFGQHNNNEGTLFVKRNDQNRGWSVYQPQSQQQPAPRPTPYIPLNKPVRPPQPVAPQYDDNGDYQDWQPDDFGNDVPF